jgi:redox-sensitive bicupin YhaK (pirin superfamily)
MNKVIHRADSRGVADHGWLYSRHTFSFASYHNPQRMGFGKLRVLNDDIVKGGGGFATHPHDNMEIVSLPLAGALRHRDSMGNTHVIRAGEVQIMSAGTGLTHSEYNDSASEPVNFLQVWVMPKLRDIEPRYGQQAFDRSERHNRFQTVVAPDGDSAAVGINQDAWFSLGDFDAGQSGHYPIRQNANGVYLFLIDGEIEVAGETLAQRDAIGINHSTGLDIRAIADSQLLVIDVPMT